VVIIKRSGLATALVGGAMLAAASLSSAGAQAAARPGSAPGQSGELTSARLPGLIPGPGARSAVPAISGPDKQLHGVFCTSSKNCWAVGESQEGGSQTNQMLHWNGKRWRGASVPNPAGTTALAINMLAAVRCVDAKDCWAVGASSKDGVTFAAVALHWNGKKWTRVTTPQPGGSSSGDVTSLSDSTCLSAKNCWAVGAYGTESQITHLSNLVLHWNGKRWSQTPHVPNTSMAGHRFNFLDAIRCLSASNCVAVGEIVLAISSTSFAVLNEALHWNGKHWTKQVTPNPGGTSSEDVSQFFALACGSSTSCWGVGSYGNAVSTLNEILHWNGKKWTKSTVPNPNGTGVGALNQLNGATCSSSRDCWAVGDYGLDGARVNEALHWNGRKWSQVGAPNAAGSAMDAVNILYAVRCASARDCWAVGTSEIPDHQLQNEILHWNGKRWSVSK
jgi:hypothetical protein